MSKKKVFDFVEVRNKILKKAFCHNLDINTIIRQSKKFGSKSQIGIAKSVFGQKTDFFVLGIFFEFFSELSENCFFGKPGSLRICNKN
jgi:hypothetical protein